MHFGELISQAKWVRHFVEVLFGRFGYYFRAMNINCKSLYPKNIFKYGQDSLLDALLPHIYFLLRRSKINFAKTVKKLKHGPGSIPAARDRLRSIYSQNEISFDVRNSVFLGFDQFTLSKPAQLQRLHIACLNCVTSLELIFSNQR